MSDPSAPPWSGAPPDHSNVARFIHGPGIVRLPNVKVDVAELRNALDDVLTRTSYDGTFADDGFGVLPVTRRPGTTGRDRVDLSGRFWLRPDETYTEVARDEVVDEASYSDLDPAFAGTYFETVLEMLRDVGSIGRVRVNRKAPFNCNSWHRDPEPRLHIPIVTNPGCLFVVNHHCTHLPADGSVYFTDTRGYHTAMNGGDAARVHLVAAVLLD